MEAANSTELKILSAAKEIFLSKGYASARMQEIADYAGINKALLHYYFRSKDQLFLRVLTQLIANNLFPKIEANFNSSMPFKEVVEAIIQFYFSILGKNPTFPAFIINELNRDPEHFLLIGGIKQLPLKTITKRLEQEAKAGNIRKITAEEFLINLLSLIIFPFLVSPITKKVFDPKEYENSITDARAERIATFFLAGIKIQ